MGSHDDETNLDYAQARYFASIQGRFTGVDPLLASARAVNPQTWNRYSYAMNNPLKYTDPTGMVSDIGTAEDQRRQEQEQQPQPVIPPIDSSLAGSPAYQEQMAQAPTPVSGTIVMGHPQPVFLCANGNTCTGVQSVIQITFRDQEGNVMTRNSGISITEHVEQIAGPPTRIIQNDQVVRPDANGIFEDVFGPVLESSTQLNPRTQLGILKGMLSTLTPLTTFKQTLTISIYGRGVVATAVSERSSTNMENGQLRSSTDPIIGGINNNFTFSSSPITVYPLRPPK